MIVPDWFKILTLTLLLFASFLVIYYYNKFHEKLQ